MKGKLLSLFLSLTFFSISQLESPIIQNFTNKVYGKNSNPEIYCIVQNKENIIFAGTSNGVLIYNGESWNFIGVKKNSYVTSIALSKSGKVMLGSLGEFGELYKDKYGNYKYKSYSKNIKFNEPVWRTHCIDDDVYFQTESSIFHYRKGKKINELKAKTSFHLSFLVDSKIYVRQRDLGLYEVKENTLQLINQSETLKSLGVFALFKDKQNKFKYLFRDDFSKDPLASGIYGGTKLKDGNYALNTLNNGIYILNSNFEIIHNYSKLNGLKDNDVKSIFQGNDGHLWLATNNGISLIEYKTDVSFYNENHGIEGDIQAVCKFQTKIFAASSKGIYVKKGQQFAPLSNSFSAWQFLQHENSLFVATSNGIFEIKENQLTLRVKGDFNSLKATFSKIIATGPNGISIFDSRFKLMKKHELFLNRTLTIAFDTKRNECWIGTINSGIIRVYPNNELEIYDNLDGIDVAYTKPIFDSKGELLFATKMGLHKFTYEEEIQKTLPDSLKNKKEFYRGFFEPIGNEEEISDFFTFKRGEYAIVSNEIKLKKKSSYQKSRYRHLDFGRINFVQHFENDIYLSTSEGIIVLESEKENYNSLFSLNLESISTHNKSIHLSKNIELNYTDNDLIFQFSAPFYLHGTEVKYRYKLLGQDENWSNFDKNSKLEFSNLFEGDYTLIVEAQNSLGEKSKALKINLSILPPWYRTIYAYLIYLIILALSFWFAIKISKKRLQKKNDELEEIVRERTKKIAFQKEEIEEKHKEITDSINYAERIQNALMMNDEHWKNFTSEHFILFKPRDVVSGDFYWAYQNEEFAIWTVADCTGHGVPGAFMSMLGIGFLNEIVIEGKNYQPASILNKLRDKIIHSLEQKGSEEERKDGMDISLCCWDKKRQKILFAGANNPLILITKNEQKAKSFQDDKMFAHHGNYLVTIVADKMPVGKFVKDDKPFSQLEFDLDKEDLFYSFSDGFPDQFGGEDGKKFMIKRFKQALIVQVASPLKTQKENLENIFISWINEGKTEQIDDVCVVGVKLIN